VLVSILLLYFSCEGTQVLKERKKERKKERHGSCESGKVSLDSKSEGEESKRGTFFCTMKGIMKIPGF
jgi:hypothetical protein